MEVDERRLEITGKQPTVPAFSFPIPCNVRKPGDYNPFTCTCGYRRRKHELPVRCFHKEKLIILSQGTRLAACHHAKHADQTENAI